MRRHRRRFGRARAKGERYYGSKHSRYVFPEYKPHAFQTASQAADQYRALAEQHRTYAQGYIDAAARREKEKGKADRLSKAWRRDAKKDFEIAQRAEHEAMRLEQG